MSASAVLAYRFDGKRSRLLFQVKPDSYNTQSLIASSTNCDGTSAVAGSSWSGMACPLTVVPR
jgi:hypothetical protein